MCLLYGRRLCESLRHNDSPLVDDLMTQTGQLQQWFEIANEPIRCDH